jgi:hypothetical protein
MQTAPLATFDTPTLPGMLPPARTPVRSSYFGAQLAQQAHQAQQRRTFFARLFVDLGLAVRFAVLVAEGLLAVRVVLVALGANPAADFSVFVYGATGPLLAPFVDVFPSTQMVSGMAMDATAILAIIVYWVAARLVEAALKTLGRM